MPSGSVFDLGNRSLIDYFGEGWNVIPSRYKRISKLGVLLLLGAAIIAPIILIILYVVDYSGSLNPLFSAIIGFEMGAILVIAFGLSGSAVLLYNNNQQILASLFLIFYIAIFGGFYWLTFQLFTLDLVPVLIGWALPPIFMGASEIYT